MKIKFRASLFLTAFCLFSMNTFLSAQDLSKEIEQYTKEFQATYNKADHVGLGAMLTTDAVRTNPDGTTTNGGAKIAADYAQGFNDTEQQVDITIKDITMQGDNKAIVTGTYHITGKVKANGANIDFSGTYNDTLVKENGKWKISIMKLSVQ